MSILRDIIELGDELKDVDPFDKQEKLESILKRKSITKWSKDAVMQFPFLCEDNMELENAEKVAFATEKYYASLIEIIANLNNITDADSPESYVKMLHQNTDNVFSLSDITPLLKESVTAPNISSDVVRDIIDTEYNSMIKNLKEGVSDVDDFNDVKSNCEDWERNLTDSISDEDKVRVMDIKNDDIEVKAMLRDLLKDVDNIYAEGNTLVKLTESGVYSIYIPMVVNEEKLVLFKVESQLTEKAKSLYKSPITENTIFHANKELLEESNNHLNMGILNKANMIKLNEDDKYYNDGSVDYSITNNNNVKSYSYGKDGKGSKLQDTKSKIGDREAKKVNELLPTMIDIEVLFKVNDDEYRKMQFSVGVKAIIHQINSDEMVNNLINAVKHKGSFFNFIRWTTGEIKFFKDFLFTIDKLKMDAVNMSKFNSAWFTVLKRRKSLANIKRKILADKQVLPNCTICVSMPTVQRILNETGIDFTKENIARNVMDDFFLIGFFIIDEELEKVYMLFDSERSYNIQTFKSLERAKSGSSSDIKELVRFMNRF